MLICDDAYITLSHVKSWIDLGRPIMSINNPVCATSTPLYTMVLSLFYISLRIEPSYLAFALNWILDFGILILIFNISRVFGINYFFSALSVTLYALSRLALSTSASGMETPLYIFLILFSFYNILSTPKSKINILLLFLLALTRPEAILACGSVILICLIKKHNLRLIFQFSLASILGLSSQFVFYFFAYGRFLPHSVIAKNGSNNSAILSALRYWWDSLFFGGPVYGGLKTIILLNSLVLILSLIGLYHARKNFQIRFLLIWPTFYLIFFLITKASKDVFTWYYLPLLPFLIIVISFGLQSFFSSNNLLRFQKFGWITLVLFMGIVLYRNYFCDKIAFKYQRLNIQREGIYKKSADFIALNSNTTSVVLIEEVGTLGYFLPRKTIDLCGIVSPEIVATKFPSLELAVKKFSPEWVIVATPPDLVQCHLCWQKDYELKESFPKFNEHLLLNLWAKSLKESSPLRPQESR